MAIIGIEFTMPAVIYVDTEDEAIHKQIIVTEEMEPTGWYLNEDGERITREPIADSVLHDAKRLAVEGTDAAGELVDWPGWDWA
jgi:hypothetical protein